MTNRESLLGRVTLADIARAADVSIKTVSQALRNKPGISLNTRERILHAAHELGYYERRKEPSVIFGIVTPSYTHPVYGEVIDDLIVIAEQEGYAAHIHSIERNSEEAEIDAIERLRQFKPEVFILFEASLRPQHVSDSIKKPLIVVDGHPKLEPSTTLARIDIDVEVGARSAIDHLFGLGHTQIGYMLPPNPSHKDQEKFQHYERLMSERKLHPHALLDHQRSSNARIFDAANWMMRDLLDYDKQPTAVLTASDNLAIGAIRAIFDRGKLVPDDFSIIGYGDQQIASFTSPRLTTITVPVQEVARASYRALTAFVEDGANPFLHGQVTIPTRLKVRESTGHAKAI